MDKWYFTTPNNRIYEGLNLYSAPSTGETIRSVKDVFPSDAPPMPEWLNETDEYEEIWPVLSQTYGADNEPQWYAWPESDWPTATDVATMNQSLPIWEAPFGQRVFDRTTGQLTDFFLTRREGPTSGAAVLPARTLEDFSPVHALDMLTVTGLLPETDPGVAWRTERNSSKLWNDPWGNPLVIATALFIAPRYGFEPSLESDPATMEITLNLQGSRNWLQERSREAYGASHELYLSIGALGPERVVYNDPSQPGDSSLPPKEASWAITPFTGYQGNSALQPLTWEATQDLDMTRTSWAQVATITEASEFTDFDMAERPDEWKNGVRRVFDDVTGERVYLTAPIAIR